MGHVDCQRGSGGGTRNENLERSAISSSKFRDNSSMSSLELLLRGAVAGVAISAPVGPVNVLCVSRTLTQGRWAGIVSGVGAAFADTLYGSVAGFSISFIISWLLRELFWIRLIGGMLLIAIGAIYYFKRPKTLKEASESSSKMCIRDSSSTAHRDTEN